MPIDLTATKTIDDHIGSDAFLIMGTAQKISDGKSLIFDIKGCKQFNKIRVTSEENDMYLVEFIKVGRASATKEEIEYHEGIYAEELKSLIEARTGFFLTTH